MNETVETVGTIVAYCFYIPFVAYLVGSFFYYSFKVIELNERCDEWLEEVKQKYGVGEYGIGVKSEKDEKK